MLECLSLAEAGQNIPSSDLERSSPKGQKYPSIGVCIHIYIYTYTVSIVGIAIRVRYIWFVGKGIVTMALGIYSVCGCLDP